MGVVEDCGLVQARLRGLRVQRQRRLLDEEVTTGKKEQRAQTTLVS
jgi:hypothetical protein